jgi:hypothetical protein
VQQAIDAFFGALQQNAGGVTSFVLLFGSLTLIILVALQWLSWILGWGRFAPPKQPAAGGADRPSGNAQGTSVGRLAMNFLATIISEFRHLLATDFPAVRGRTFLCCLCCQRSG